MDEIYKYSILEDIGLIIQYHENSITYEGMKQLKTDIMSDKAFNTDYGFIIDIRRAKTELNDDELIEYGNWVVDNLKLTGLKRLVLLTSNPEQVVNTTKYLLNEKISPLQYKICSTLEASAKWLNINASFIPFIEAEIEKLREY